MLLEIEVKIDMVVEPPKHCLIIFSGEDNTAINVKKKKKKKRSKLDGNLKDENQTNIIPKQILRSNFINVKIS